MEDSLYINGYHIY